ncbi:unnamed protein product [Kluyveromyces dobzhanskii CBS 2104]|uniref:WGS project CCBQ000000000 data, contig 00266 n=1 Tax=Kluyveromyces dobzhanskii CBS 2104 TaxID=1427455 RepID=A0A0A8L762_9SACH|nr:unnamed protein product [Kluyveromyces dobzhanskii CBS 2104]
MPYEKPSTLKAIETLFYHTGLTVSAVYVFTHLILTKVLSQTYAQRLSLSHDSLMRLRRLVNSLRNRIKSTSVTALGENHRVIQETKVYVDRCQQTDERIDTSGSSSGWARINVRLGSLTDIVRDYNCEIQSFEDLGPISLKAKLFIDQLKDSTWQINKQEKYSELVRSIREMKGWFIHGRIPKH